MRIISLSVDGIHQAAQRGLYDWLATQDADIICLQDLRALEYELDDDIFHPQPYFSYFFDSGIKHHNGVAIYTKHQPKALIYGLGFNTGVDMEGRYLQIDYENYSIGSLLAPGAFNDNESLDVKVQFFDDYQALLHKVTRKRRHFIICGNWAMAHKRKDVENWQDNSDRTGFLGHEQQWMNPHGRCRPGENRQQNLGCRGVRGDFGHERQHTARQVQSPSANVWLELRFFGDDDR